MTDRSLYGLRWLRRVALLEGVSYLLLLGVGMPLKYLAGVPLTVKVVGWAHGLLFVLTLLLLALTMVQRRWPLSRGALVALATLLPFGPFVIDARLRREQEEGDLAPSSGSA